MSDNPKLPILDRVSYSSLTDFNYCPKFFELNNIKRLKPPSHSVDTHFGTLLHNTIQNVLGGKIEASKASMRLVKTWTRYCRWFKQDAVLKYSTIGKSIVETVQEKIEAQFGKFKVLEIEYQIKGVIENHPQYFKGFIDIVLQLESGRVIVADFKTTSSIFFFNKYRDKFKDYQITLYKKFYSELKNIELDQIDTCFILLEKNEKSKQPISFVDVSSGNKKIKNATEWLDSSLKAINKQKFVKNRTSCHKFGEKHPCFFFHSEHCSWP